MLFGLVLSLSVAAPVYSATLKEQVRPAFLSVYGREPSSAEKSYWLNRVERKEKTTYQALVGAMSYQKTHTTAALKSSGTDNKQTMIKEVLPLFVSIYGSDPTESEKAWWRKRISCGEIKRQKDLQNSMQFHKAKKVRKGSPSICGGSAPSGTSSEGIHNRAVAGISTHPMGDEVRIGIFKTDGRAIHITANGSFQIREGGSKILGTVGKDDIVEVSWSDGKYHVRGSGLEFDPEQEVRLVPLNQAIMQIKSYSDPSVTYPWALIPTQCPLQTLEAW